MTSRVVYDFQIFAAQYYGGISRYFCELARRVEQAEQFTAEVAAPFYLNRYLPAIRPLVRGRMLGRNPRSTRMLYRANWLASPLVLGFRSADILHETYYQMHSVPVRRRATVLTVYDMIHERCGKFFPADDPTSALKRAALSRADHVICISESTRRDLIELTGVPEEKTSVIHLGAELGEEEETFPAEIRNPFLLFVGSREGYKNFEGLLRAFAHSRLLNSSFQVVCFGGGALTVGERELISELGLPAGKVLQIPGSDALLKALYRRAAVFVCPSLYEGFGIPLLEAMSVDCPVACSNTSSLPEVAGDAASFFDPRDEESIIAAVESVACSEKRREELIALGRQRGKAFSWDRCAEETMALYTRLAG